MISSQTTRISSKKQYVDTLLIAPDFKVAALDAIRLFQVLDIWRRPRLLLGPWHAYCLLRNKLPTLLESRGLFWRTLRPTSNFFEIRRQRHAASRRRSCQAQPKLNQCRTRPGIVQTPDDCLAPRHITPPSHPPCGLPE